ncbi:MAG: DUF5916 domain-containing protein [Gemmatimonadota bacterium]
MFDRDPGAIAGRLGRRDADTSSDLFRVAIDSYHDHRTAFIFAVNAAGVRTDELAANDNAHGDTSWDPIWRAEVRIDSLGWVAEIRIPFSQLRFSTDPEQTWGINFSREIFRKSETVRWTWARNTEQGYASLFGHLEGLENIPQPRRLEVLPYAVASADFDQSADPSSPFNDGSTGGTGMGLDLKYGLSSNLTLDATFNPDFGQVEVDPAVVNLSAYETYFEERRPFFVEGANLFQFGAGSGGFVFGAPNLFYSRRIGRAPSRPADEPGGYVDNPTASSILGATKLSGKVGAWSVGVLDAVTSAEKARIQAADGTQGTRPVEPLGNYGVLSVRRDFRDGATGVGVMATSVHRDLAAPLFEGLRSSAYAGGVDFFHRFAGNQWAVNGTFSGSRIDGDRSAITAAQRSSARYYQRPDQDYVTLDPDATSMTGYATSLQFGKVSGNWTLGTDFFAYSPGFEVNDGGYATEADEIFHGIRVSRRWLDPGDRFRRFNLSGTFAQGWNFGGTRTFRQLYLGVGGQLLNYWSFNAGTNLSMGGQSDAATRGGPLMENPRQWNASAYLSSDRRKKVSGSGNAYYARNRYGGWGVGGGPSLSIRPNSAVDLRLSVSYSESLSKGFYVTQRSDPTAAETYGGRYLFSELFQRSLNSTIRANVSLTPGLSVQLYAQPLLASGDYERFKELARPGTFEFLQYGVDGASTSVFHEGENRYAVDPDGPGPAAPITFGNPDFSFRSLRSNLVLRWEYRPGSTLFLVWNHGRSGDSNDATVGMWDEATSLLDDTMRNTFMVKFNYWLSM